MKNLSLTLFIAALVFAADLGTKAYVVATMRLGEYHWIIPGFFRIAYTRNSGGAFSLLPNAEWLFLGAGFLAVVLILWYGSRARHRATRVALGLVLGGAAGNMADRAESGKVVDFLDFRFWPVFNLADAAVVVGIVLLVWLTLTGKEERRDDG